jgi:hypothetical protein
MDVEFRDSDENQLISFFNTKCSPYVIHSKIYPTKIEFYYRVENGLSRQIDFDGLKFLCYLDLNSNKVYPKIQLFDLSNLAQNGGFVYEVLNLSNKTKLDPNLYNILFNSNWLNEEKLSTDAQILLVGTSDGFLHWYPIDKPPDYNKDSMNDLILVDSGREPLVHVSSFKFSGQKRSPFDALFKNNASNSKTSKLSKNENHDCLFVLTKCGQIHLFSYVQNDYMYKKSRLPYCIKTCIRFFSNKDKIDYLVFACPRNNVYSIKMDDFLNCKRELNATTCLKNGLNVTRFYTSNLFKYFLGRSNWP